MSNKKNKFKKLVPEYGKILRETMKKDGITVNELSTDADCCDATISGLRWRDDWRVSEVIQMSKLTSHNFVHDLLPELPENTVPASSLVAAQKEITELKNEKQQDHDTILELRGEVKALKELLEKK